MKPTARRELFLNSEMLIRPLFRGNDGIAFPVPLPTEQKNISSDASMHAQLM